MPFKSAKQARAMFAKGGKTAKVAYKWAKKYGIPGKKKRKKKRSKKS